MLTRVLVVAGHDSSGAAGIDADRDAARAFETEALCVVTARTVQDATGVRELGARAPATWLAEARAALEARPAAIKFGLLPGTEHVQAAAQLVREARALSPTVPMPAVVVDPVIASSSGFTFMDDAAVAAMRAELVPLSVVLTPNLFELAQLAGAGEHELAEHPEARLVAARQLLAMGAGAVLAKGGHGTEDPIRDLTLEPGSDAADARPTWIEHPRLPGRSIRGSGCRHATAVACELARGAQLPAAARAAAAFVSARIERSPARP